LAEIDGVRLDRALTAALRGRLGFFSVAIRTREHLGNQNDRRGHEHHCADQTFFYGAFH